MSIPIRDLFQWIEAINEVQSEDEAKRKRGR
jgi:hypothetical protein